MEAQQQGEDMYMDSDDLGIIIEAPDEREAPQE